MKYVTFDFDLWPLFQGHEKISFYFIFLHLWYKFEQNRFSHLRENWILPRQEQQEEAEEQQQLQSYDCSPL